MVERLNLKWCEYLESPESAQKLDVYFWLNAIADELEAQDCNETEAARKLRVSGVLPGELLVAARYLRFVAGESE